MTLIVFAGLLTRRELDVLRLLAEGHTNRAVADALVVSEATVKFHVASLLRKLHVANSVTDIAFRWGFCDAAHFSRVFKRAFGSTPSDVRHAALQLNASAVVNGGPNGASHANGTSNGSSPSAPVEHPNRLALARRKRSRLEERDGDPDAGLLA